MQPGKLLTQLFSGGQQRLHDFGQIGHASTSSRIRSSNLQRSDHTDLQPEVAQKTTDIVLDGDSLFLQTACGPSERAALLARQRLHMHGREQIDPHHLRDAARVVAIAFVDLRLQERFRMPRLDADDRQSGLRQPLEKPLRQRPGFETDPFKVAMRDRFRTATRSSGWLTTFISRQIFPLSSTMHTRVSLTETSSPA